MACLRYMFFVIILFCIYTDLTLVILPLDLDTIIYISLSSFECVFIMSSISLYFDLYFKEIHSKEYIII